MSDDDHTYSGPDGARLLAEIEAEARLRRRDGSLPPGFERELDLLFDRYAPPATSNDFESVVSSAEELAYVNADAPAESNIAAGGVVKKGVRKAVYWYVNYVTSQVQEFAVVAARGLRLLGTRMDTIEGAVPALDVRVRDELGRMPPGTDIAPWIEAIVQSVVGTQERVVHAECGDGALLRSMIDGGLDAYGVEPRRELADGASDAGLEVRDGDALEHVRVVPDGVLGGVVLSGCVDRYPLPWLLMLLDEVTRVLVPGGHVVVVTATPETWGTGSSGIVADLAPGRPLQSATWEHLASERGYVDIKTVAGAGDDLPATVMISARRPAS